jgi:hypothetical protein
MQNYENNSKKTKAVAFRGKYQIRIKIVTNDNPTE